MRLMSEIIVGMLRERGHDAAVVESGAVQYRGYSYDAITVKTIVGKCIVMWVGDVQVGIYPYKRMPGDLSNGFEVRYDLCDPNKNFDFGAVINYIEEYIKEYDKIYR